MFLLVVAGFVLLNKEVVLGGTDICQAAGCHCNLGYTGQFFGGVESLQHLDRVSSALICLRDCAQDKKCQGISWRPHRGCLLINSTIGQFPPEKQQRLLMRGEPNAAYFEGITCDKFPDVEELQKPRWKDICEENQELLFEQKSESGCDGTTTLRRPLECLCNRETFRRQSDKKCVSRNKCENNEGISTCKHGSDDIGKEECYLDRHCDGNVERKCGTGCACSIGWCRDRAGNCVLIHQNEKRGLFDKFANLRYHINKLWNQHVVKNKSNNNEHRVSSQHVECGKPDVKPEVTYRRSRIVGGQKAKANSWPWQVFFDRGCGGSIYLPDIILSASHCFEDGERGFSAHVGYHRIDTIDNPSANAEANPYAEDIEVEAVYRHEDYDPITVNKDIAMIKLKRPITFDEAKKPICLPKHRICQGEGVCVTGWGLNETHAWEFQKKLLQVCVFTVNDSICDVSYSEEGGINPDTMLCAGGKEHDACQGDSGGPLVHLTNSHWELQGIVSWGIECGGYKPGVYTEVTNFVDWIQRKAKQVSKFSS